VRAHRGYEALRKLLGRAAPNAPADAPAPAAKSGGAR